MRAAKLLWVIGCCLILIILLGFSSFYFLSHDSIISFALNALQRPDLETPLRNKFFTLEKFNTLKNIATVTIPFLAIIIFLLIKKRNRIIDKINDQVKLVLHYYHACIKSIKSTKQTNKILFVVILTLISIRSIYYALHFYAQYDECWNYNYFLSNTPLTTLVAWNNYPLHNLISFLFLKLLPDTTFVLRIPSILFGLLSSISIFVITKKIWSNEVLALAGMAIFVVLPMNVFYFMFARGVIMAIFFGIVLFYLLIIVPLNRERIFLTALCTAFGTYSMISFPIYTIALAATATIISLVSKGKSRIHIISFLFLSIIFSGFLLSPFLIGSGISLGTSSQYISTSFSFQTIADNLQMNALNFIGTYYGTYIFLVINLTLLFVLKKERAIIIANLIILSIEITLPLLSPIHLPARALGFEIIAYFFTLLLIIKLVYQRLNKFSAIALSIICILSFSYISHNHIYLNWSYERDKEISYLAEILNESGIKTYHNESKDFSYYVPGVSYYYKLKGKEISYSTSIKNSTRFRKVMPKNTEALIIPKSIEYCFNPFQKKVFENDKFEVYTNIQLN